ncbi:hypothetical protein HAZT_HAZT006236 [Hyalella azteca]|uniref:C2H2-type domain-containing protein n=1 Tax=Hyalella azteca TaxID=294128 RepID=A0A6A0GSR4_HYAAZ|nr:hypothetical protein HAZT_HAZT006236 [Hyalella azteca]
MSDATTPVDKVTGEPSKNALSPEATARAAEVSAVPSGLCIVVKAASQSVPDMVVDCLPDWTVKDLKHFLSEEHSLKPVSGVRQRLNAGPAGDDWMQNMFSANLPADDLRAHADAYKQYYENYMRSYMAYADGSNESAILAAWRQQLLATQQLPAATSNDTPDQQPPAEAQPLQAPQAIVDELPIADEDAVAHDWLDSLYVLVRFGILVYRVGWFRALGLPAEEAQVREARQQQQAQQRQPQQQQPRAPPAEEQQPPAAPAARATNAAANEIIDPNPPVSGDASSSSAATTPDVPAPGTSNDTNATSNDATSAASGASAGTNNAPHNEDVRLPETAPVVTGPEPAAPAVSFLTLSWTFFSALLTPRGSKNGTGMGRGKSSYGRGSFRFNSADDRPCSAYDLRHIPDPFGTARRGRPRSRFIVDLGEQNHEAWTKARLDLNVSDAELTTLLLSLLESRRDLEDTADSDTMLGLINSEYSKWKDKFASQVSMLSHFASIHNTNCCTCLGIKKKKLTPVGTGKRGRPRKYPPPVGYGPGMQRPDTIDEDGNIFEPQCILKDGTIVKAEPHDEKPKMHNGEGGSDLSNPGSANGSMMNSMNSLPPRAMLTHEEMQKRREYYSNHKNKIKYVCHFCQVHFYHKPNFDYHISKLEREGKCRIYDKVNNLYLCESCGEGFSWREKLEKHLRLAEQHGTHNQKELLVYGDFQCSMCGKTFNKRNTYLQHIKWHEDREDVPCVICATLFKQTELRRHLMEVHNNDSLPCCYCGKLFTSRKYLEKHELIHQSGNFPCPECGKCFSQKMAMQHHLRSHSLDKEYSCETCGQMFTQRLGLCHHLRKQFGPGEFNEECSVCSTYFCNEYDLQIHKRKVHNMTEHMEELPPESYLPINMRNHMSPTDRNKHYSEANNMVKNMLGGSLGNNLDNSMSMTMKSESEEPMDDSQVPSRSIQHSGDPMRDPDRNSAMNDLMRNTQLRENLMRDNRDTLMRDSIMRDNLLRDNRDSIMRDEDMAGNMMRGNSLRDASGHNENPVRDNVFSRNEVMRNNLMRDEDMRSSAHRNGPMQDESMRSIGGRDDRIRDENMSDDPMRSDGIRDNNLRENLRDGLIRDNPLRELAMRSESSLREDPMRENIPLLMNEHMRHMVERRELDPEELRLNPSLHNMHHQSNEDQLHVPQDLTRMTSQSLLMNDNRNGNNGIPNPQQHMADMRPSEDSPSRLSDTPGAGSGSSHMSDQLGRMAVENFNRMTSTPGGYLAEHLRRMAENQSRSGMASVMSDTAAAMMSHYDDRDYSRIDNLRSMSRASPADPMARLGDNLSHMGVIRPAQTPSSTPQWPPHMQNHSPLDGMNQSPQSTQHTLYPLPFWPYDPSLRHYNH